MQRSREFEWQSVEAGARQVGDFSGLAFIRGMMDGTLPFPPICALLGLEMLVVEQGYVVWGVQPEEWHAGPGSAVVFGGFVTTLFDSALGCAVRTMLPAGTSFTTVQVNVHLAQPVLPASGPLRCTAKALHSGRRLATAEATLSGEDGTLYGHATTTCLVFPARVHAVQRGEV